MHNLKFIIYNFRILKLVISGLLILHSTFYILHSAPVARAQTFSLGLYPPLLEVMMMPGKSVTQAYQLENYGDDAVINTAILPFEPKDEYGNISLLPTTNNPVVFSFNNADISLGQPFVLKANESQQIVLKIKAPENAPEDDYYFTLLFSTQPGGKFGLSGSQEAGVIGSNLLITVSKNGKPIKKGEVEEFKLLECYFARLFKNWCLVDSFDKPDFLLRIKNTGRTFWKPFGKIETKGFLGQKWEQELLPDNILSNSIRQINVATPSAQPSFLIGRYRANVNFSLDEGGHVVEAKTSFFALPFKPLIALLTAIILLFIIKSRIRFTRKTENNKVKLDKPYKTNK